MKLILSFLTVLYSFSLMANTVSSPLSEDGKNAVDKFFNDYIQEQYDIEWGLIFPVDFEFKTISATKDAETDKINSYNVRLTAKNPAEAPVYPNEDLVFLELGANFAEKGEFSSTLKGLAGVDSIISRFIDSENHEQDKQDFIDEIRATVTEFHEEIEDLKKNFKNIDFNSSLVAKDKDGDAHLKVDVKPKKGVQLSAFKSFDFHLHYASERIDSETQEVTPATVSFDATIQGSSDDETTKLVQDLLTKIVDEIMMKKATPESASLDIDKIYDAISKVVEDAFEDLEDQEEEEVQEAPSTDQ